MLTLETRGKCDEAKVLVHFPPLAEDPDRSGLTILDFGDGLLGACWMVRAEMDRIPRSALLVSIDPEKKSERTLHLERCMGNRNGECNPKEWREELWRAALYFKCDVPSIFVQVGRIVTSGMDVYDPDGMVVS